MDSRLAGPAPRALLITSFALTFSYLAWRGLEVAGKLAIGICLACCFLPFAVLCLVGAFHLDLSRAKTWTDDPGNVSDADRDRNNVPTHDGRIRANTPAPLSHTQTCAATAHQGPVAGLPGHPLLVTECVDVDVDVCVWGVLSVPIGRKKGLVYPITPTILPNHQRNLNAFDSAASFAGEVRDPGRTYPRAMLVSIAIIVASYVLPILVGTLTATTDIPYDSWTDGTFTEVGEVVAGLAIRLIIHSSPATLLTPFIPPQQQVARQVGGEWLAGWIVAAAAVSTVGLYLAEMSGDGERGREMLLTLSWAPTGRRHWPRTPNQSQITLTAFQMMGMAELGMLPSVLGRKSRHDTPTHAILLATAAIVVMSLVSSFQEIVSTTNALYRCVNGRVGLLAFLCVWWGEVSVRA